MEENGDEDSEKNDVVEAQEDEDEEIVFLNLSVADKILAKNLEKYQSVPVNEFPEEVKKLFFDKANNLLCLGELEMHKSDFHAAVDVFLQALDIRNKYDQKSSREIAEIYFLLADAFDFDMKKSLLCYYKTKLIMEFHLNLELGKLNFSDKKSWEGKVKEVNLDFEEINEKDIILDKKLLQTHFGDTEKVEELREILTELYEKVKNSKVTFRSKTRW